MICFAKTILTEDLYEHAMNLHNNKTPKSHMYHSFGDGNISVDITSPLFTLYKECIKEHTEVLN